MKNNLKLYLKEIDTLLKKKEIKDLEKIKEEHLLQIQFFQHERFVHLLVTVFVGIVTILFFLFGLLLKNSSLFLLFFCGAVLFIPYIFHYYYLENGVQKMYKQYWELNDRTKEK